MLLKRCTMAEPPYGQVAGEGSLVAVETCRPPRARQCAKRRLGNYTADQMEHRLLGLRLHPVREDRLQDSIVLLEPTLRYECVSRFAPDQFLGSASSIFAPHPGHRVDDLLDVDLLIRWLE